ncbi:MAG: CocE/NonD family hydrolase [Gemmatimonadetes bacterium]|nr:MAG: CocE/NonD family hydrolase [Gemmatimonadota bacterium]
MRARLLTIVLFLFPLSISAQEPDSAPGFDLTEVMIPARDGVKLHTTIFVPRGAPGPLPIIFTRTPYGIAHAGNTLHGYYRAFARDGYIFAFQDIRGRYTSEGQFVMLRPPRPPRQRGDPKAIDESTDAYDTIDWLLAHVPNNNGRVGMLGISYPGWLTLMAMLDPHPALKAASPQASPADMFLGDDFHHNGAFRLSYGFEYATRMETSKEQEPFTFDRYDTYQWYLDLGPLSNVNAKYLHGKIPTWNDFVAHANYDAFWQRQGAAPYLTRVTVPTLNVAGWWDQEDFYGPLKIYELLERYDTAHVNSLVVGPWNHGGWSGAEGEKLGEIDFGSPASRYFQDSILAPWFAHFLKDRGERRQPEAVTFEAGANQWRTWEAWPPRQGTAERRLYFQGGGRLSFEPPTGANAFERYVSDPAHPVPYRHRPIPATYTPGGSGWPSWLVEDQRFVDDRPDVLTWETEPLTEDVPIAGDITAHLFVSTTGTDGDWIVKLIDVYPEDHPKDQKLAGWELMVANDVFRARFRNSFEKPAPLTPGQVTPLTIDLHSQDYRFLKGHRIMVQVQSTWFPLIDRNPQTFVPNIFEARGSDYRPATIRVYRSARWPSSVEVRVVTGQ